MTHTRRSRYGPLNGPAWTGTTVRSILAVALSAGLGAAVETGEGLAAARTTPSQQVRLAGYVADMSEDGSGGGSDSSEDTDEVDTAAADPGDEGEPADEAATGEPDTGGDTEPAEPEAAAEPVPTDDPDTGSAPEVVDGGAIRPDAASVAIHRQREKDRVQREKQETLRREADRKQALEEGRLKQENDRETARAVEEQRRKDRADAAEQDRLRRAEEARQSQERLMQKLRDAPL